MACSFFLGCRVFVFTFDQSLIVTTRRWSLPTGPGVVYLCPWTAPAWPGVTDEELTRNMWPQMPAIKPVASHQAYGMSLINVYLTPFFWVDILTTYHCNRRFFLEVAVWCAWLWDFSAGPLQLRPSCWKCWRLTGFLVGWRAMVSRRRRKLKGSSQTSKLDDTSWELHRSTNAHSWTSEGCKQVWR